MDEYNLSEKENEKSWYLFKLNQEAADCLTSFVKKQTKRAIAFDNRDDALESDDYLLVYNVVRDLPISFFFLKPFFYF